jgi:exo-beta-1,3-glucanase (GH17 family)
VFRTPDPRILTPALASFALTALAIVATWWWLGAPVALPSSPLAAGEKLYCVSYAPFRGSQNPLVEGTRVEPQLIDADIALIAKYSNCVRTYSVDDGADIVLASARRYGLKVLFGIWVSNRPDKVQRQIASTVALAREYFDVIRAIVVGNEVLLRGEMSAPDLVATIREVKARVQQPVTYADVWEFWLRYPDVQSAVDFVTIHILPYWEDFPISAAHAAAHVGAIRRQVATAMPGKDIVIGEFGWPAQGRQREGALPSPSNQARVITETLALAKRESFPVNIIEAFDQPWKRGLEGAAGGYWGILDRETGALRFRDTISDHPNWPVQASAGIALTMLAFAAAFAAGRGRGLSAPLWIRVGVLSFVAAVSFGWTIETVPIESFSFGTWLRSLAFAAVAAAAPIICAAACAASRPVPTFASILAGAGGQKSDQLDCALGVTLIALMLVSVEAALGLVFDPRYRDFPFAPLSAAVFPFLVLVASTRGSAGQPVAQHASAEGLAAAVLALSAVYVVFNESFANWQAVWFCAGLIGLALILARARVAPSLV